MVTLAAWTAAFAGGPLLHVHGASDASHGVARGVIVHSHFPGAPARVGETEDPALETERHQGQSLDLFLSSEGRALGTLRDAERDWGSVRLADAGHRPCPARFDRTHDPPVDATPPRAPPSTFLPFA